MIRNEQGLPEQTLKWGRDYTCASGDNCMSKGRRNFGSLRLYFNHLLYGDYHQHYIIICYKKSLPKAMP
jgi:hypothetical protein